MNAIEKNEIISAGTDKPFWKLIEEEVKNLFDIEYVKLRKCVRDSAYYKLQGKLDAYEQILKIPQKFLDEAQLQKINQSQKKGL